MPEEPKGKIFINYRRGDDSAAAGRLYDRLEQEFARSDLFMDVDDIAAGADFVAILERQVAACDIFLAVIGRGWLEARDAGGGRRLDNPNDFVHIEIASALRLGKHVIPVLVNGAPMPPADGLPEPLKPLARRNAIRLTHERFKADAQGLLNGIEAALAESERAARTEAERLAVEYKRAETEAWAAVAGSESIAEIEAFLKAWPSGEHAAAAKARVWHLRGGGISRRGMLTAAGAGAVLTVGGALLLWKRREIQTDVQPIRTLVGHSGYVNSVAFSPDGRTALSGGDDHTLKLWDVATGKELRTFTGHSDYVVSVAFSPDGSRALSGSDDKTLKLWDIGNGKELSTFVGHADHVNAVAFSPDGRTALSGSDDNTLRLWDVDTGKELRPFTGDSSHIYSVAVSLDGRLALSGNWKHTLKLWDIGTGKELHTFAGHTSPVLSAAFSPDGRTALSGSRDHTLKLWDVASGKELCTFTGHSGWVRSVAFSQDGRSALSGGDDQTLKLWDLTPYFVPEAASR